MSTHALPAVVAATGQTSERLLDVRPVLAKGGDPFHLIMKTVQELGAQEALHLIVGFEPAPLYAIMKSLGRNALTEQHDGAYHVWFYLDPSMPASPPPGDECVPLKPPVTMDVRGMEPPGPMVAILEKLAELGPGAQLRVHHHREPVLLYEKLKLRGYAARTERHGEGDYLVHVAPAWSFEEGSTSRA
jgi:uncharacterized protein (DUF2249 family)